LTAVENPAPRTASLGRLPFSLSAEELRRRGTEILAAEQHDLADLAMRPGLATVENFLAPLNRILVGVRDVGAHSGLIFQAHPDADMRQVGRDLSEEAERFFNAFRANESVYGHLRSIDLSQLNSSTRWGLEKLLREMRRAGVEQPAPIRKEILDLANRLDRIENEFSVNISSAERSVFAEGAESLRGLPADFVVSHPPDPNGKIRITTKYPDSFPVLSYADDADLRRRVLYEFMNVAAPENLAVLQRLLEGRREIVRLLGYSDFARFALEDKMAERPEVVASFLDRVNDLVREPSRKEEARLLARKRKDLPEATELEDWDGRLAPAASYYGAKIRTEEYGVDLRMLRAYLPYPAVRDGLFDICRELFGLEFRRDSTAELWHPTVEAYDVLRNGEPLGRCYFDFAPRPGKFNHAAHFTVRTGVLDGGLPQGALICNFLDPKTPAGEARMEYRDVVTFFHEFGHLLHSLLAGHGRWVFCGAGSVERDFIEAPSQLFEEWARDPATLARFARNPDTGETIPEEIVARLKDAEAMGRATWVRRQAGLAEVSLEAHLRDPQGLEPSALYREVFLQRVGVPVDSRYNPMASFGHMTGYSAFYYTYLWSAVIARDLLTPFVTKGSLTDRATAQRYAAEVLAPGGSRPAAELVRNFLGREYNFDAFERWALAGAVPP
jgi:Zn-dependent oligopeptidase